MLPSLRPSLANVPRWGLVAVLAAGWGCHGDDQGGASTPTTTGIPRDVVCEWARVVYITDGDTVRVAFDGRPGEEPVRYIGVDTPEIRDALAELGCLYGIGSALAQPMPLEHLLPWLGGRLSESGR